MEGTYLQDCLQRRLIFFTGKGGVGKSVVAWATALLLQKAGKKVTVLDWSPFEDKPEGRTLSLPGIEYRHLKSLECFREWALQILKFDKIYETIFENKVLRSLLSTAPGVSEAVVAGKISQLFDEGPMDTLIVDLPASGHAFSFFRSTFGVNKLFRVGMVHKETEKIVRMFTNPATRIDFVAIPEEMSLTETGELYEKINELHPFHFGALHLNQCLPDFRLPESSFISTLPESVSCTLKRFELQWDRERRALEEMKPLPLKKLVIPKYPSENTHRTIESIAEVLARA